MPAQYDESSDTARPQDAEPAITIGERDRALVEYLARKAIEACHLAPPPVTSLSLVPGLPPLPAKRRRRSTVARNRRVPSQR